MKCEWKWGNRNELFLEWLNQCVNHIKLQCSFNKMLPIFLKCNFVVCIRALNIWREEKIDCSCIVTIFILTTQIVFSSSHSIHQYLHFPNLVFGIQTTDNTNISEKRKKLSFIVAGDCRRKTIIILSMSFQFINNFD